MKTIILVLLVIVIGVFAHIENNNKLSMKITTNMIKYRG